MPEVEIVGPVVFLAAVFVLVVLLLVVYKRIMSDKCTCLRDPGGREQEREKKSKSGYDMVSGDEPSDDIFVPPTMNVEDVDETLEIGELVGPETLSAYSAYSAYGETASLDQTYMTERGLGRLKFDAEYIREQSCLKIRIIEGDDFPSKEQGGAPNFRLHLTLLPDKQQRHKSKARSRYSPKFDETFTFKDVLESQFYTCAIRFRLYGLVGTGKLVGETFLQLADIAQMESPVINGTWRAFRNVKTKGRK